PALARLEADHPEALVNLAVTFYTGNTDRVSHVPDVCYVADGYHASEYEVARWPAGGRNLEVRFIRFRDASRGPRLTKNVAYLFHSNGSYRNDPWAIGRHQSL